MACSDWTRITLHDKSQNYPYASSIASSASSSSSSIFSAADSISSQCSAPSSQSSVNGTWEPDRPGSYDSYTVQLDSPQSPLGLSRINSKPSLEKTISSDIPIAPELRQHPRRTQPSTQLGASQEPSAAPITRPPPSLVRQCDRACNFVENLVDTTTQMIEVIWPLSVMSCNRDTVLGGKNLIGLRTFIQEVLKRSKTSYSTLQVALYYLILIKPFIPRQDFTMEQPEDSHACRAMQCGRRMFLAALILASKYLQDRNYSARAWSKISGLKVHEINTNEMAFVTAVNWNLHVPEPVFQRWTDVVLKYSASAHLSSAMRSCPNAANTWKSIVPKLTPKLDNLDLPETPSKPLTSKTPDPWPTTDYKEGNGAAVFKIDYELPIRTLPLIPTTSAAKFSSPCLSSNEQTPTAMYTVPRVLEPTPQMGSTPMGLPPLPSLGPLPTPQMTPQSRNFSTPAVSATGLCPLKSAMSFAMKQVQSTCMARTVLDQWRSNHCDSFPISSRRSSLARSVSSFSSPESMISDTMSRSSRSSSISSVSSSTCALPQPRLAMQATRRCANMQLPGIKEHCRSFIRSPMLIDDPVWEGYSSSPDSYANAPNEYFHKPSKYHMQSQHHTRMHDHSENEAAEGLRDLALSRGQPDYMIKPVTRKRERQCSMDADASVQHDVRALMSSHSFSDLTRGRIRCEDDGTVLTDSKLADSFLLSQNVKLPGLNLFNYQRSVFTRDEGGRKRMCCVEEKGPIQGPGMWSGIL